MKKLLFIGLLACIMTGISSPTFSNSEGVNILDCEENTQELSIKESSKFEASSIDFGTEITKSDVKISVDFLTYTNESSYLRLRLITTDDLYYSGENYTIGYYGTRFEQLEAGIVGDFVDSKGSVVNEGVRGKILRNSTDPEVYSFGQYYGGSTDGFSIQFVFDCPSDLTLDTSSVKLFNIVEGNVVTDEAGKKRIDWDYSHKFFAKINQTVSKNKIYKLGDYMDFENTFVSGNSTYADKRCIQTKITMHSLEAYKAAKESFYEENKEKLEKGDLILRSRLSTYKYTTLNVTYNNKGIENIVNYAIPVTDILLDSAGTAEMNFLLAEFPGEITQVTLKNFQLYVCLLGSTTLAPVGASGQILTSFSDISFRTKDILDSKNNIVLKSQPLSNNKQLTNLAYIIPLSVLVVYSIIVVFAYFYLKKKYANDEFRQMNTKSFVTNAICGIILILSLVVDAYYIVSRSMFLNNTYEIANPLDAVIVCTSVVAIIFLGYWIKYFYTSIKNSVEKKRVDKLNLNKKSADDGTN